MRFIYLILVAFAAPVAAFLAWLRGVRDPNRRERLADRFGFVQATFDKPVIWVHAASMGEVQAGVGLVRCLVERYSHHQILITTMTATGAARVRAMFGESVTHAYLPYDLPSAVKRFFDRVRPRLAVILETELWPNVLRESKRRNILVLVASARISPRTEARYRRMAGLFRAVLNEGVTIAAQTAADAQRFELLGATAVQVVGNIKFDIDIPDTVLQAGAMWREKFGARFVWVAGSTHEGEETAAIEAHRQLLEQHGDALLILAPRHPQRFDEVQGLLRSSGLEFAMRSTNAPILAAVSIMLVDTLGELLNFYAAADLAFVGGSLVPIGGHNLLEPAALGVGVLCGPHISSTQESATLLAKASALIMVHSAEELAAHVMSLSSDSQGRAELGRRALVVVQENRGALARTMELIARRLPLV